MWNDNKKYSICDIRVMKGKEKESRVEKVLDKVIENFWKFLIVSNFAKHTAKLPNIYRF